MNKVRISTYGHVERVALSVAASMKSKMGKIAMPRKSKITIEPELTKGQLRKLNALKKSVGVQIGEKAFSEWLATVKDPVKPDVDKNAELVAAAIEDLIEKHKLTIPNTGYLLKRGRGRAIVTRPDRD